MDYWQMEQRGKEQREEILRAAEMLRLQRAALRASAQPIQPGWFARNMVGFGNWMVAAGERIRKRYEYIPAPQQKLDCNTAR
jgi:hypothetical protein